MQAAAPMTERDGGDGEDFDRRRAEMEPTYMDVVQHAEVFALRTNRSVERAHEIVSAIKEELWTRWITKFEAPESSNKAYAEQAVRNHKVNALTSSALWNEVIDAGADIDEVEVAAVEDPHDDVCDTELQGKVDATSAKLPEQRRLSWQMRMNGYSYGEIAEALGITKVAARLQYSRANRRLRKSLALKRYLKEGR